MALDIDTVRWFALRQDADESGTTGSSISVRNSTALGVSLRVCSQQRAFKRGRISSSLSIPKLLFVTLQCWGPFTAFPPASANRGKDSERGKWNAWNEAGFQGTPSSCCASQRASWDLRCDGNVEHVRTVPLGNSKRSQRNKEHLLVCPTAHAEGKAAQGNLKRSVLKRRTDSKSELNLETKTPYWQLLKDPRWQRKRLEVLNRANFACRECGGTDLTLHVHHRYYISGRKPWEYPDWCFMAFVL